MIAHVTFPAPYPGSAALSPSCPHAAGARSSPSAPCSPPRLDRVRRRVPRHRLVRPVSPDLSRPLASRDQRRGIARDVLSGRILVSGGLLMLGWATLHARRLRRARAGRVDRSRPDRRCFAAQMLVPLSFRVSCRRGRAARRGGGGRGPPGRPGGPAPREQACAAHPTSAFSRRLLLRPPRRRERARSCSAGWTSLADYVKSHRAT